MLTFRKSILIVYVFLFSQLVFSQSNSGLLPYQNSSFTFEERVDDLVGRMTLAEKTSQMLNNAPAIIRLNIPAYNWWNECLH